MLLFSTLTSSVAKPITPSDSHGPKACQRAFSKLRVPQYLHPKQSHTTTASHSTPQQSPLGADSSKPCRSYSRMAGLEAIASREMKEAPREREKSSAHSSSAVPWRPRKHAEGQLLPPPLLLLLMLMLLLLLLLLLLAERWQVLTTPWLRAASETAIHSR